MGDEMTSTETVSSAGEGVSEEEKVERHEFVPDDVPDDIVKDHDQGNQSWWPDPNAKSSDPVQALGATEDTPEAEGGDDSTSTSTSTSTAYDPGDYTVSQVVDHVKANPDQLEAILTEEKAGQNRTTLVTQLESLREA